MSLYAIEMTTTFHCLLFCFKVVIAFTSVSDFNVGMLLAFGSGQYLYVGAVELLPQLFSGVVHDVHCNDTDGAEPVPTSESPDSKQKYGSGDGKGRESGGARASPLMRFLAITCFAVAAVAVGLVLLDHEHCSEHSHGDEGDDDGSDGHGH